MLILALVVHVTAITHLWLRNRVAKPAGHHVKRVRSTIAARTVRLSGVLILAFVVFHILQFTTFTIHPTHLVEGQVYANVFGAFHRWWLVVIYVSAVVMLELHIIHGLWSGAQTAGVDNPDGNWFWRRLATGATVATVVGFALVPILFVANVLPKPVMQAAHIDPAARR